MFKTAAGPPLLGNCSIVGWERIPREGGSLLPAGTEAQRRKAPPHPGRRGLGASPEVPALQSPPQGRSRRAQLLGPSPGLQPPLPPRKSRKPSALGGRSGKGDLSARGQPPSPAARRRGASGGRGVSAPPGRRVRPPPHRCSAPQTPQPRWRGNARERVTSLLNRTLSGQACQVPELLLLHLSPPPPLALPGSVSGADWAKGSPNHYTDGEAGSGCWQAWARLVAKVWVLLHYLECSGPSSPSSTHPTPALFRSSSLPVVAGFYPTWQSRGGDGNQGALSSGPVSSPPGATV